MPLTRQEALRQRRRDDDATLTEDEDSVVELGRGDAARSSSTAPTAPHPTMQPTDQFLSTLIEAITRAQMEANKSLITTLTSTGEFRTSTPIGASLQPNACSGDTGASNGGAAAASSGDAGASRADAHAGHAAARAGRADTSASRADAGTSGASAAGINFAKCTARFTGASKDAEVLEAFLDSVQIYKECTAISDAHALRGLPMLLEGEAAVWWRGVKASVSTWSDALARLRDTYGVAQPAHQVLRGIYAAEQRDDERVDSFICKVRALIAKLPYKLDEQLQIDMCYGLLHRRVIKRVARDSIVSLDKLLYSARIAEESYFKLKKNQNKHSLSKIPTDNTGIESETATRNHNKTKSRCRHCRSFGHLSDDCRHRDKMTGDKASGAGPSIGPPFASRLRCYGCGKPDVVKSRCDVCNNKSTKPVEASFNNFSDNDSSYVRINNVTSRELYPMVDINVMGRHGVAVVDTGATHSLASPLLYRVLVDSGVSFSDTKRYVHLADGTQGWRHLLSAEVSIVIEGREIVCPMLVLPGANTKTLLGVDFLTRAGIIIDVARRVWTFADDPDVVYNFVYSYVLSASDANTQRPASSDTGLMYAAPSELTLRPDEGCKLTPEQRRSLDSFIDSRAPQFARNGPPTEFATHRIKVSPHQEPIACPPYRMSQTKREALQKELDKLLQDDVIEECESPWASNVVLVGKKDGSLRLCIDYRKLNAVTEPDRYPLPRIEDVLHAAKTSEYMTTLDLRSGYHQVSVCAEDQDKTAFTTPLGTFRFKRMPMGLRNSGATFQRLMDRFRSNLKGVELFCYLDDLIVLSPGPFERHLADLEVVFDRLAMFKLRVNRDKSFFAKESVQFLGHIIVPGGIQVDPDKTAAIDNMAVPRNVKQLKCFLQTSSWYRRFINNYAEVARPLTNLLKKSSVWQWDAEQQEAFERIKSLLVTAPILRQADESKPYVLCTDSSAYCLGAVLMQGEGQDERPIEYASRLLTSAERNYSTTEREALAVVWALGKFRGYVETAKIVVRTDHQPLRWLMSQRSPSGRLARWALTLQEFDLVIEYTPGRSNVVADTLSRPVCPDDPDECELRTTIVDMPKRSGADVRSNQLLDPEVRKIIEDMESDEPSRGRPWSDRGYVMSDGILYRYSLEPDDGEDCCLVVPEQDRRQVLVDLHDAPTAGHFGVERTLSRVRARYYWPGMRAVVESDNFVPSITPYLKQMAATLDQARDTHEEAQAAQKEYADKKRRPPPDYKVGDLVLLKTQGPNDAGRGQSAKFIPRRDGPYRIGTIVSPTTYGLEHIQTGGSVGRFHVSNLTPYHGEVEPPVREKRKRGRPRRYLD
ncbi:uncharacterized protein LOC124636045 [Helicoverpa zea]|uniref:uncharacterized protein LOC124636045 n=1 Tax=Helicoverpa zea TaxID=7113 RepID=UPI001F5964BD|nr:uncharacterized protein LOC124636045 [Helicoverpa zea]